ncbi:hypothetical protein BJX99DRAFT_126602 [Aspergillus californicus]
MASMFESDYRNASAFFLHQYPQYPEEKQAPYIPSTYYALPGGVDTSGLSCTPYITQNVFGYSMGHAQHQYNHLVNDVVSDVLARAEEEPSFTPPPLSYTPPMEYTPSPYASHASPPYTSPPYTSPTYTSPPSYAHQQQQPPSRPPPSSSQSYTPPLEEKALPSNHYPSSQNNDLMWGSDLSFGPNGYRPVSNSPPQPKIDEELVYLYTKGIQPISHGTQAQHAAAHQTIPLQTQAPDQDQYPPELAELGGCGMQRITGKKRRRLLHIVAERNRRLTQNKMYEELYRMVPGLESSSRSTKREVLTRTADFLEDLVDENRKLAEMLRRLPPVGVSGHGHGHGHGRL